MENKLRIRMVHIESLIETLEDLYHRGVDFVDILGTIEDGEDTIGLSFCKSYMDEKFADNFENIMEDDFSEEEQSPANIKVKLSDEDLNQLI